MRRSGDKGLQRQSVDSSKSHHQLSSLRTTTSSSSRAPTLSTSLLFARQRSSDSSALSSLPGDGLSGMAEATTADTTIYPDTINPEFQPAGGVSPGKSPLSSPVVEREPLHVESPLFADLSSDYAMRGEESTMMPPNQTLDQMLAQDSKGTQQLLPLQQRQDAVLKVNALADRVVAAKPPPAPPVAAPQPVHAHTKRQSEDSAQSVDDGSEDWDVVGSDQEDAATAHASHVAMSPIPGHAAYRMSASGRVGSSSTRHLSSAGGGISQYDEFVSMDRVPRFDTGEPQYTYGDGGGPPPGDCRLYIAVMVNMDDVIESDSPKRTDPAAFSTAPQAPASIDGDEDDDSDSETSDTGSGSSDDDDESETPSPTPRVLLPSPMHDRSHRDAQGHRVTTNATHTTNATAATATAAAASATLFSTQASIPGGAGTATLDTSGDVTASGSKALTSVPSSSSASSQIPSPPQRDSNSSAHGHMHMHAAQQSTPPRHSALEALEHRRSTPTSWDYGPVSGTAAHTAAPSPLRATSSAGGASRGGAKMRSYMHASATGFPHAAPAGGASRGAAGGSPNSHAHQPPGRASYQMNIKERRTADHALARSWNSAVGRSDAAGRSGAAGRSSSFSGGDRSFTDMERASSMDQPRDHERLRYQGNASAHSSALASVHTPDSGFSMHASESFPVQVMEPSLHEWPLAGGQQASPYGANFRYSSVFTAGGKVPQLQGRSDDSVASRADDSFVSGGMMDVRAGLNYPSNSSPHHQDGRHAAYPGKKVERWQELPRQAQLVQKQIKREMQLLGSLRGDPLGQFQFHIPLFAAMWGTIREAAVVPCLFTRAYKEVLGSAVTRGNLCRFCAHGDANNTNDLGVVGARETWRKRTMSHLPGCPKRFKAVLLWFRDATHLHFFTEPNAVPAPFTEEEAAELIAVSFMNNMLNRVTIAQLTDNETLPMKGMLRPFMQALPSFQAAIYKSLYKPVSKEAALPGLSAEVRPQARQSAGSSFKWAAPLPHIADALSYLEGVVNYHLRGRFLPLDLCDKFMRWMDQQYNGIYQGRDQFDDWLRYAAKDAYPDDPQRQDAMLYMLLVACSPAKAGVKMNKVLRARGWRQSQVQAMAPFAAFHAARITALWQATVPCVSGEEAANDALWAVKVPDSELW